MLSDVSKFRLKYAKLSQKKMKKLINFFRSETQYTLKHVLLLEIYMSIYTILCFCF